MTAETEAANKVRAALAAYQESTGRPLSSSRRLRNAAELLAAADKAHARYVSLLEWAAQEEGDYADELRLRAESERLTADRHRARAAALLA